MQNKSGWVCVVKSQDRSYLYGPDTDAHSKNIEWNNLELFPSEAAARSAQAELVLQDFADEVTLAECEMVIADTLEDAEVLEKQGLKKYETFLILWLPMKIAAVGYAFLGAPISLEFSVANGAASYFSMNGFKGFDSFEVLKYAAKEVLRQGQSPQKILRLKLRPIE